MQRSTEIGAMFRYFIVQLKTSHAKIGGKPELNDLAYALFGHFFSNFFDDNNVELEKSGM